MGESDSAAVAREMLKKPAGFLAHTSESVLVNLMAAESWDRATNAVIVDDTIFDVRSGSWVRDVDQGVRLSPVCKKPTGPLLRGF